MGKEIIKMKPVSNGRKKSNEQFQKEAKEKNNKIIVIGEYVNSKTKLLVECKTCKNQWDMIPNSVLRNIGCPQCKIKNNIVPKEDFIKELKDINSSFELIGEYTKKYDIMEFKCKTCNTIFRRIGADVLCLKNCPECYKTIRKKTNEQFLQDLKNIHGNLYTPLEKYKSAQEPLRCKCNLCGNIWTTTGDRLLQNHGCPECMILKHIKSFDTFIKELNNIMPTVEILSEYKSASKPLTVKCKICGYIWDTTGTILIKGKKGCYYCGKMRTGQKIKINE